MPSTKRTAAKSYPKGVRPRHSRSCPMAEEKDGGQRCHCTPSWRAWVSSDGKVIRKTFDTMEEAASWRTEKLADVKKGRHIAEAEGARTLTQAAEAFLAGVKAEPPRILNRTGDPYKPSCVRSYEQDLRAFALPAFGHKRMDAITRRDLRELIEDMQGKGLSGSRVRNAIAPLRVLFGRALNDGEIEVNPTVRIAVPRPARPRERAATKEELRDLLAAIPAGKVRAALATAAYAGLRLGELRGLQWGDVDLANGVIHVRRSYDDKVGIIAPKSRAGLRTVGVSPECPLHDELTALRASARGRETDYVFPGRCEDDPMTPSNYRKVATEAWAAENERRAEEHRTPLVGIGFHECRHTYVSLAHAAGVSLERIGDSVGHASASMTNRYRHLLPGHEQETASTFAAYLAA